MSAPVVRPASAGASERNPLVAVALGLFVAAFWALRFVGEGKFPAIDSLLYFLPIYQATYERLAAGSLPLWNPYQLCGEPWLASLQGGFFYPGHVLYLVLPLATAHAVSGALHLVIAALLTHAFCRRVGLSSAAGILAAAIFSLRGALTYSLIQPNFLEAATWLPLGMLAVVEIARGSRRRGVALLALATVLSLLAGYPQPTAYLVYAWTLLLVALLLEGRAWRTWSGAVGAFAAGGAIGALTAAVQLLPAAELTHIGTRSAGGLDPNTIGTMSIITPAPVILGTGAIAGGPDAYGVIALALVPVALQSVRMRGIAVWAIFVAVMSGLLALAGWGPLFRLYLALPLIGLFRYPHRILVLTDFALAVAAAIGLDVLTGPRTPLMSRAAAAVAVGGLLAVLLLATRGWAPPNQFLWVAAIAGVAGVLFLTTSVLRGVRASGLLAVAIAVVAVGDISRTGWQGVRLPYAESDVAPYRQLESAYRQLASRAGSSRAWLYFTGIGPALGPKQATRYELRVIDDYEPMNTYRQAEYMSYLIEGAPRLMREPWLFGGSLPSLEPRPGEAPPATRRRLLDLAALRLFALPSARRLKIPAESDFVRDAGFEPVPSPIPGYDVFENPHALPRAFVTYRTRTAPPTAELLAHLARDDFDPLVESYVEDGPELQAPAAPPRGHPATIVVDGESTVEIDATLAADGLLVLADTFYPGWRATVDGTPAPIYPTNHLFRGVPLSAGTHRVRFDYRPRSLEAGAALSAVGTLALVALFLRRRPR